MQKLLSGIRQFQTQVFKSHKRLYNRLQKGQSPSVLFITCSDSRIVPQLLTQTEPGELFILRNAGNLVPPYGAAQGGEAATIEYAVAVLKVQDVIVCGHSHCGAMQALLQPKSVEGLPAVRNWLEHAETTRRIIDENFQDVGSESRKFMATIELNAIVQLQNLHTHPSVAAAMDRGELNLHAWVYKFESGEVFSYCSQKKTYVPLEDMAEPEAQVASALAAR